MGHVVVWDPKGSYWEGSLIEDAMKASLEARGVVLLPALPQLFKRSGVGGYMRRGWGSGWPLNFNQPKLSCPLTLFLDKTFTRLHWVLRLVPDERYVADAREGKVFSEGTLRIISDTGQGAHITSVQADQAAILSRDLGKCDERDGWTLRGTATIQPQSDGFYGFGLYGMMPGTSVAWAAVSQATS